MQLEPDGASWRLERSRSLSLARCNKELIELVRGQSGPELILPLIELVEVIQVLDWLAGAPPDQSSPV